MLLPAYVAETPTPGITFRLLDGRDAHWELAVLWQRGKIAPAIKTLVDALADNAREICGIKRAEPSAP